MKIQDKLVEIFKASGAGPFLFVGSGLSRRYLGLEGWRGLLEKFCVTGKPFEYYLGKANSDYPTIAQLLAKDFSDYWWDSEIYQESIEKHKSKVIDITSPLRIEICNHFSRIKYQSSSFDNQYTSEIALLSNLNIDGIITTNWDMFLESIFPDYKVYIGQDELLFSNPQGIGEIYKIHGCSTVANSLVLTRNDYDRFEQKNTYLAAKLITLFVEHPIVFIGYSLSDDNIRKLLHAISICIGEDKIEKLRKNLIFVEWEENEEKENIADTFFTIDSIQIPLIRVQLNDFSPVYRAIDTTQRKIPARILRYCKEQLYELVNSNEPERKLCVLNINEIEKKDDIEFVVGVGVAQREIAEKGYASIEIEDLILDLLHEGEEYDCEQIISHTLIKLAKRTKFVPVFKYLKDFGIDSKSTYKKSEIELDKLVSKKIDDFRSKSLSKSFDRNFKNSSMVEIIAENTPENAAKYIPFLTKEKIDLAMLKDFLLENKSKIDYKKSKYASDFRKLAVLYDKLKWGW